MASPSLSTHPLLSQWLSFDADDRVTLLSGKVELGQGIATALIRIAADALGVAPSRIDLIAGDTDRCPDESYTAGSLSIEVGGGAIDAACSYAKRVFKRAAAQAFGVDIESVQIDDGVFSHDDARTLSYWQLRDAVDLHQPIELDDGTTKRAPSSLERLDRVDLRPKFSGAAFIHDLSLPRMVYGRVLRPDHPRAWLATFDRAAVLAMPGVIEVIVDGSFIALAAVREEQAVRAIEAAERVVKWHPRDDLPDLTDCADAGVWLATQPSVSTSIVAVQATAPNQPGTKRFEARYSKPYIAHASIGPSCAIANVDGDRLTVWSHSQGTHALKRQIALALGRDESSVRVIHRDGAGCYGHNGADDVGLDAALLAVACGRPVQVQWRRRDEMIAAPWGSAMHVHLTAQVDADHRIVDWTHDVHSQTHIGRPGRGDGMNLLAAWQRDPPMTPPPEHDFPMAVGGGGARNSIPFYDFARQRVDSHLVTGVPLRTSALRSLGAFANVFAIESFIDEIARAGDCDPLEFRLQHLRDERAQQVLREVARIGGWDPQRKGDGERGWGLAVARYKGTGAYCAVMVEVELAQTLRVRSVFAAVDCGRVVHADGAKNQVEGGIVQAISWALKEHLRWTPQGVTSRSWDDYPILRFDEVPTVEVALLDRPDLASVGVGECAAGPTAAAIGNALAHASGIRARHLPLTPERIVRAMDA